MNGPIVVVGDILLDRDVSGSADRLSPDAPVPVLTEITTRSRPGGAGLAATFLAEDGADVRLIGCVGADAAGDRVRELLSRVGVVLIEVPYDGPTPEKIRLRAGQHPLLRVDRGTATGTFGTPPAAVLKALHGASAVLVSDYGRGLTSVPALRRALTATAEAVGVVWDPHPRGATPVPGARVVCPNRIEAAGFAAAHGAGLDPGRGSDADVEPYRAVAAEARILRSTWRAGSVVVTMGERGALLAEDNRAPRALPAAEARSGDPCGAGDRFAAAVTFGVARGWPVADAVAFAVEMASRYVGANGPESLASIFDDGAELLEHEPTLEATP